MAHILVIEDDVHFCQILVQMLKQDGHQVATAGDDVEAMHALLHTRFDLIAMDILMPNMDAIEFIIQLWRQGNDTPLIAMSGGHRSIPSTFTLESAILFGVKATLTKPFSHADLRKAIREAWAPRVAGAANCFDLVA